MTTDPETPYRPIDCDQHSVLELLAMRRVAVTLRARRPDGSDLALQGRVHDVRTRSGAEYLVLHDAEGAEEAIRLDRLQALYGQDGGLLWRQETDGRGKDPASI
jgi:transcriptional antiterminator Rof (Rho-off)